MLQFLNHFPDVAVLDQLPRISFPDSILDQLDIILLKLEIIVVEGLVDKRRAIPVLYFREGHREPCEINLASVDFTSPKSISIKFQGVGIDRALASEYKVSYSDFK